jgi:adenylate cyclase
MKSLSTTGLAALAAVVLTLFVALLLHLPYFAELEGETGDQMVALRYWIDKQDGRHKPDARLIIAAIDERTIQDLGSWPLPRTVHGEFLAVLATDKPKALGWDIFFTETAPVAADDEALLQGAALFPHMVTSAQRGANTTEPLSDDAELLPTRPFQHVTGNIGNLLSAKDAVLPFPALRKETYFGFADEPGKTRRIMPLVVNVNGKILPSFDCQVLMQYWGADPDQVTVALGDALTIPTAQGAVRIPIDATGCFLLNYRGRLEDFHPVSYGNLGKGLADQANGVASGQRDHLPALKDAILVVGVTASGTDAGPIPLDPTSPLVVTHLNVMNNILQHDFLQMVSPWIWMPVYALFLFIIGNTMLRVGIAPMIPIGIGALLVVAAVAFIGLYFGNELMPVLNPEIGVLILAGAVPTRRFFGEEREKARIRAAMGAYLSHKVMNKILEHPDNVKLGGIKQEITIMFCDIRGFTAYCDNRDPQETMDVLNDYMETMTQVVFKHDGTIDKYIGDCIMAFWNAPEPQPDHAQQAVLCAMEMRQALAAFKAERAGLAQESFECGIGIHTGEALVGNMGSSLKRNYTAMGSTVNLAARLESMTKKLGERILISEDTLGHLEDGLPIVDRGEVEVAGFAQLVHVFAVVADMEAVRAAQPPPAERLEISQEEVTDSLSTSLPMTEE